MPTQYLRQLSLLDQESFRLSLLVLYLFRNPCLHVCSRRYSRLRVSSAMSLRNARPRSQQIPRHMRLCVRAECTRACHCKHALPPQACPERVTPSSVSRRFGILERRSLTRKPQPSQRAFTRPSLSPHHQLPSTLSGL